MTVERGAIVKQIMQMLDEDGPMTRAEICKRLGRPKDEIAAIVSRLNKRSPVAGKRIYVKSYRFVTDDERRYPRAVYAVGDKPDRKRPEPNVKLIKKRYWTGVMESIVEDVYKHLDEYGPQTVSEIYSEVPKASRWSITSALKILRSEEDRSKRRVYIFDYVTEPGHVRRVPRFKIGNLPDRPRPSLPPEHRAKVAREKISRMKNNSVFNLGLNPAKLKKKEEQ